MKWEYDCLEQLRLGPRLWAQGQSYEKFFLLCPVFHFKPPCSGMGEREGETKKKKKGSIGILVGFSNKLALLRI